MLRSTISRTLFLSVVVLLCEAEASAFFSFDLVRWRSLFARTTGTAGQHNTTDNSTNATTPSPHIHNESTVPPYPAPSNGTNVTNATHTHAPTIAPHNGTSNFTTLPPAPSNYSNFTLPPMPSNHSNATIAPIPIHNGTEPPTPTHNGTEPPSPTPPSNHSIPSNHSSNHTSPADDNDTPNSRMSFWRIVSKTIAWLIFIGLSVLAFGGIMSHRYRIYFFLRGVWFTLLRLECTQWIVDKLSFLTRDRRGGGGQGVGGGGGGGAFDSGLNTIIFDSEMSEGLLLNEHRDE